MITVMQQEHCRQMYMWHEVAFNYPFIATPFRISCHPFFLKRSYASADLFLAWWNDNCYRCSSWQLGAGDFIRIYRHISSANSAHIRTHIHGGSSADLCEYAKGLLLFTPAWVCYVLTVLLTSERIGVWQSIALGMAIYAVASWFLRELAAG